MSAAVGPPERPTTEGHMPAVVGPHHVPSPGLARRAPPQVLGFGFLILQLLGMAIFSVVQYGRWGMNNDFGAYSQAWSAIGHGAADPYVSLFRTDFLHNNLEFAMYPLALLGRLFPSPVMLSLAQDAGLVATEAVALLWIRDYLSGKQTALGRAASPLFTASALMLALNPWSWETAAFPLHFNVFATLFACLAARDLWRGRYLRLGAWVPLALVSEALGGLYLAVAGLGITLARGTSRKGRAYGLGVTAVGISTLAVVAGLGLVGRNGSTLTTAYRYLLPSAERHAGIATLLAGVLTHPGSAASMLGHHLTYVAGYVVAGGILGVLNPWGAAGVLLVILPNALSERLPFIAFPGAFQSWAAQPFLVVGSVMVFTTFVAALSSRGDREHRVPWLRRITAVVLTAMATLAALELVSLPKRWLTDPATARELAVADSRLPASAEVVADQNVIGRLAEAHPAYDYVNIRDRLPVVRSRVVLILGPGLDAQRRACQNSWEDRFGTQALYTGRQIVVLSLVLTARTLQPCP
ncbi:MAG TPA: DUF2079 domain-containing protein [Acidimicrobiales bacterium]|nr:DUF2079 domain-containing protein [Acidimicrobiales bacterium]